MMKEYLINLNNYDDLYVLQYVSFTREQYTSFKYKCIYQAMTLIDRITNKRSFIQKSMVR